LEVDYVGLDKILQNFCMENGYTGKMTHAEPYEIVISKGKDNAGAFLTEEEFQELDEEKLTEILIFLDREFREKFNK
jgi:hypothetical protein